MAGGDGKRVVDGRGDDEAQSGDEAGDLASDEEMNGDDEDDFVDDAAGDDDGDGSDDDLVDDDTDDFADDTADDDDGDLVDDDTDDAADDAGDDDDDGDLVDGGDVDSDDDGDDDDAADDGDGDLVDDGTDDAADDDFVDEGNGSDDEDTDDAADDDDGDTLDGDATDDDDDLVDDGEEAESDADEHDDDSDVSDGDETDRLDDSDDDTAEDSDDAEAVADESVDDSEDDDGDSVEDDDDGADAEMRRDAAESDDDNDDNDEADDDLGELDDGLAAVPHGEDAMSLAPGRGRIRFTVAPRRKAPRWFIQALARRVGRAARRLGIGADSAVTCHLVDDPAIARLNAEHMGKIGPTDVLSFPAGPIGPDDGAGALAGDVVISVDAVRRQARARLGISDVTSGTGLKRQVLWGVVIETGLKNPVLPDMVEGSAEALAAIDEATVLAVHGLCHLLGHDHGLRGEARAMHRAELRGLRAADTPDVPRPYGIDARRGRAAGAGGSRRERKAR